MRARHTEPTPSLLLSPLCLRGLEHPKPRAEQLMLASCSCIPRVAAKTRLRLLGPASRELSRGFPFILSTNWRVKLAKCIAYKGKRKIPMKADHNVSCAFYTVSFPCLLANAARLHICMA